LTILTTLFLSAALTALGILILVKSSLSRLFLDALDKPNAMHQVPVPRIGGLPMLLTVALVVFATLPVSHNLPASVAVSAAVCLGLFSLMDDRQGLPPHVRLVAHIVAAIVVVVALTSEAMRGAQMASELSSLLSSPLGLAVAILGLVWVTNLYNFMDGANGLAGFMGLIGFGTLAVAAHGAMDASTVAEVTRQIESVATLCAATSGACAGFLVFNFPSGRIFLGDVGAVFLGFLAGAIGLVGAIQAVWPWWLPLLVFSPFILDATVTLLRRMLRRERIWVAHRQHLYHRLILHCGWSHQRTALTYAAVMLLACSHGLWVMSRSAQNSVQSDTLPMAILIAWVLIYVSLFTAAEWHVRQRELTKTNMSSKKDQGVR